MIHHVKRATRHLIFWTLLTVAVSLTAVRLMLVGIDRYKTNLEGRIGALVGKPVKLNGLGAKMRGFSPELVLKGIDIGTDANTGKSAMQLKEIRFGINLVDFLVSRDALSSSWVTLIGAQLTIYRNPAGEFAIEGLASGNGQPLWLFQGRQYKLLQSRITFKDIYKGVAPFVLDAVNIAIMNEDHRHRINILTELPRQYGQDLKIIADFQGYVDKPSTIGGTVFFEGKHVKFPKQIANYLPLDLSITSGSTDFKVWSKWQQARPIEVTTAAQLQDVKLTRTGKGQFTVRSLDTLFQFHSDDNRQQLDINRFLLASAEKDGNTVKNWHDAKLSLASEQDTESQIGKIKLYTEQLDLAEFSTLLKFFAPFPPQLAQFVGETDISGTINNLALYAEPKTKKFAVDATFDALSVKPLPSETVKVIPGLANLSGRLKGSEKLGKILIDSRNVRITLEQLFNNPLLFSRLKSLLDWRQAEDHWEISSQAVELDSPAFTTLSRVLVELPKATDRKPFLSLQTTLKSDDIRLIMAYAPSKAMTESLNRWLGNAFVSGKITKGDLLIYGNVDDFPFNDRSGVAEAVFEINGMELNFNPKWPHLTDVKGQLFYQENSLRGLFKGGKIDKVDIAGAEALIPKFGNKEEELTVTGLVQGEIGQVLGVLQQSPIARKINAFVAGTKMAGQTKGMFKLDIPLWSGLGREMKLDGNAQFDNADLIVNKLGLKVSNIVGELKYNMKGIYSDPIQARALDHPVQIEVAQNDQETLINANGISKVSNIEKLFNWPHSEMVEGEGAYQLQLQIPKSESSDKPVQLNIKSTLEGFDLELPGTLAKRSGQKKPSSLTIGFEDATAMPIELNYNNELKAAVSFDSIAHKINSGHFLVGNGNPTQRKIPGIKFEINKGQLPLQDWLVLAANQNQLQGTGFDLKEIKVQSQSALWKKTRLGAFDLSLNRNPSYWKGGIDSTVAKGEFQVPVDLHGPNPVVMDMDMLNLSAIKQFKSQGDSTDSGYKPLVDIKSKKTLWHTSNLGELSLETGRTPNGIAIKSLKLEDADQKLTLSGDWKNNGINSTTHLDGKLDIHKADRFFDKLNITKDLTETTGTIAFNLEWNTAPWLFSLADLRGRMNVDFGSGRILSIEPGFGRLLGVLAMAQWLKRLQLDFSDIFAEGLTYNSIKGDFNLSNGKAATQNLTIDAVPAMITITGETDYVKQTVDHIVKVVPKSSDAIPIAGTIVGEVAAMVGKTLTGKDQQGFFFGKQYRVKGSWDNANIIPLQENDGIFQKTWNNMTDFSWLEQGDGKQKQQ